jgi:hypothetical protein
MSEVRFLAPQPFWHRCIREDAVTSRERRYCRVTPNPFDFTDVLTDGLGGLTTAVAAMVAATFAIAVTVRLTFKGARIAGKALGLVK